MTSLLKGIAKALPHPLLLRVYYAWFMQAEGPKVRRASVLSGIPELRRLDLRTLKNGDTVFILGSGPSINEITDSRWECIVNADTIGFNWWPLHRVVPKVYVFESLENYSELFPYFMSMFEKRAHDYANAVKIVNNVEDADFRGQLLYAAPQEFKQNMYVGFGVPVVARTVAELRRGFRFMRMRGGFIPGRSLNWLFKYGGSVTAIISLAVRMGYKRVVLCGIDLGPQAYFYQDPSLYPASAHWEFAPRNEPHLTTRRLEYLVPAQEVIWTMNEEVLQPMGIELLVENKSSTLYPRIPAL